MSCQHEEEVCPCAPQVVVAYSGGCVPYSTLQHQPPGPRRPHIDDTGQRMGTAINRSLLPRENSNEAQLSMYDLS